MTLKQNAWWLSPVITILLAVLGGIFTWQTVFSDLQKEVARLETRVTAVEDERDMIRTELQEIRARTDQIYLLLAGNR